MSNAQRYYWRVSGMKDVTPGLTGVGSLWVRAEDYEYLQGVSAMQERFLLVAIDRAEQAERDLATAERLLGREHRDFFTRGSK